MSKKKNRLNLAKNDSVIFDEVIKTPNVFANFFFVDLVSKF